MIVTVTPNPALDKVTHVERVKPDVKLRCGPPEFAPGGGGVNVARAAIRLGAEAHAIWAGAGPFAQRYAELLDRDGVSHHMLPCDGDTRENLIVVEDASEQNYRFGMPGARLDDEQVDSLLSAAVDHEHEMVVASGSLPPETPTDVYRMLGERLRDASKRFVLDTSGDALREGVRGRPSIIKPNIRELGQLAGRELEKDDNAIVDASRRLIDDHGIDIVITSLAASGLLVVTGDGDVHRVRAPDVEVKSAVGAGDSTLAGVLVALQRGEPLEVAARFGAAAGASAVATPGFELCDRHTTERLFDRNTGPNADRSIRQEDEATT